MGRDLGTPPSEPCRGFPKLTKSDTTGPRGLPSNREDQSKYWLQKRNEEELWEMWDQGSRFDSEPKDADAWNDFRIRRNPLHLKLFWISWATASLIW